MDITVKIGDYKINVRTAGVIIHNNKVLTHKNLKEEHYALIGGRIKTGENSEEALRREMQEELGKEIEITGYIGTIENFFKGEDENYQEIMFVHKMEFKNEEDKNMQETMTNKEGEKDLIYEWIDLNDLEKYPLKPKVLKTILKDNIFPVHSIEDDRK